MSLKPTISAKRSSRDTRWACKPEDEEEDLLTCESCWQPLSIVQGSILRCDTPGCEENIR